MKKSIAFFDLDGTITTKDTLLEFIRYCKGNFLFYWGFLLNSPFLVAYKLRIISNQAAKEKMLRYYFKEMPVEQFNEHCDRFARNVLPRLIRSAAQAEIDKLKQNGFTIVIVSASPENWIKDWARNHSLQVIATRLTLANGKITGMIAGKNCHGEEKVRRIKEEFMLADYAEIYAYGDSKADLPMLGLAQKKHYKPFTK